MARATDSNITSRRNFLVGAGITSAAIVTPLAVVAGVPVAADPITMLAAEFEAAWAASDEFFRNNPTGATDEDCERMFRSVCDLANRIADMKATTLDGLRLKARALMWCDEEVGFMDGNTTDERLARGIVHDLLDLKQAKSQTDPREAVHGCSGQ